MMRVRENMFPDGQLMGSWGAGMEPRPESRMFPLQSGFSRLDSVCQVAE